jgi:hypothetical protein
VRSGASEVLAIGVLHAGRDDDAALVARARAGDADAVAELRRVHGEGVPGDAGHANDEFSLDGFSALVDVAARIDGARAPRIVARFPFLVGDAPDTLPGIDDLRSLAERAFVVATTDPLHHGAAYGTPPNERHAITDVAFARTSIEEGLALLAARAYADFARHAARTRSDFRDAGPTLAALTHGALAFRVHALELVDYAAALAAAEPSWVAAALVTLDRTDRGNV